MLSRKNEEPQHRHCIATAELDTLEREPCRSAADVGLQLTDAKRMCKKQQMVSFAVNSFGNAIGAGLAFYSFSNRPFWHLTRSANALLLRP